MLLSEVNIDSLQFASYHLFDIPLRISWCYEEKDKEIPDSSWNKRADIYSSKSASQLPQDQLLSLSKNSSVNVDTLFKCHTKVFVAIPDWGINMFITILVLIMVFDSFQSLSSRSELSVISGWIYNTC